MHEWWTAHFTLLIKSGLNKRDIKKVADSEKVKLRGGYGEFIETLRSHNIPLVIISASGMGEETISIYLEKEKGSSENIYIISNEFKWDKDGNMIGCKQPIIHSLNKAESVAASNFHFYEKIKNRKNVLLLGDNTEDVDMIIGFEYENLIKVGFLNENIEENLEKYKESFDIVILNDGSMEYINGLLKEIIV